MGGTKREGKRRREEKTMMRCSERTYLIVLCGWERTIALRRTVGDVSWEGTDAEVQKSQSRYAGELRQEAVAR